MISPEKVARIREALKDCPLHRAVIEVIDAVPELLAEIGELQSALAKISDQAQSGAFAGSFAAGRIQERRAISEWLRAQVEDERTANEWARKIDAEEHA